jgi:hypothetical protein
MNTFDSSSATNLQITTDFGYYNSPKVLSKRITPATIKTRTFSTMSSLRASILQGRLTVKISGHYSV